MAARTQNSPFVELNYISLLISSAAFFPIMTILSIFERTKSATCVTVWVYSQMVIYPNVVVGQQSKTKKKQKPYFPNLNQQASGKSIFYTAFTSSNLHLRSLTCANEGQAYAMLIKVYHDPKIKSLN